MSTETKKDDGYLIQKNGMWNTPPDFEAFEAEIQNWIRGHKKEDQFGFFHIMYLTWNYLAEVTRQKPKAELAEEIANKIMAEESLDQLLLYVAEHRGSHSNRQERIRKQELTEIILSVFVRGEK
tara:strand:- start:455 stop:826 length:372 start_codon:yes stop_codon:yes gene_type:complete